MFGAKGLNHDEDKNAVWEITWIDGLLVKKNQDYLAQPGTTDLLKLRN